MAQINGWLQGLVAFADAVTLSLTDDDEAVS
jgi:hypothetical protein